MQSSDKSDEVQRHEKKQSGENDKGEASTLVTINVAELCRELELIDIITAQKSAITEYIVKPCGHGNVKIAMARIKETSHKFDGNLHVLFKREYGPDGPHTNKSAETLQELSETIRANRPHITEGRNSEPPDLLDDLNRKIEWYREHTDSAPELCRPTQDAFVNRIAYSNDSGLGADGVPNAFYRISPPLFAQILEWELSTMSATTITRKAHHNS